MKKPQWLTIAAALALVLVIYSFGKTIPPKSAAEIHSADDGHNHGAEETLSIDTLLATAKKGLQPAQVMRLNMLENTVSRGNVKEQQLEVYHQLSHFWGDSARIFEPYAWYEAEAARLENSEKTLTFAAHLFLENLQGENSPPLRKWKAMQAKDLFERSLKINPDNDSSKVGLGACYLFGNISPTPMEGINKIREVVQKDSTNVYAQMMLVNGSLISGQLDKAISRLLIVNRLQPADVETKLMLGDVYERSGDVRNAIQWYEQSLPGISHPDARKAVAQRIEELKKQKL